MNKLASIVVVILLLCGGALWFLAGGSLNDFIKQQIERVGTKTTEQSVKVEQVEIKLTEGAGAIKGLTLANPAGYQSKHAFSLGHIGLDINIESLTQEPIVLDEIVLQQPQVFVEVNQDGSANVKDILDAINRNLPKGEAAQETAPETPAANEPKIRVDRLTIAGVALALDLSKLGNKQHQLTLPDIHLSNIGGEKGMPASQLGAEVAKQALTAIWKQTKKEQKQQLKAKLEEKAKKKLTDLLNKLKSDG